MAHAPPERALIFRRRRQPVTRLSRFALAVLAALSCTGTASAIDYPTHTVKWVVGYPPGGTTDVLARIMAQWLSEKMGQQFIIENKPGGGNNIGVDFVVNSPPDGYTMLLVNPANGINEPSTRTSTST